MGSTEPPSPSPEVAALGRRLDTIEQHLRSAADQLHQVIQLYNDVSVEVARLGATLAKLNGRFNNLHPERWNCPHCSRIVSAPAYPDDPDPQLCQVCGRSGVPVRGG